MGKYLLEDALGEQTRLLGAHDKVVRVVLVVDKVLESDAGLALLVVEELLVAVEGQSSHLLELLLLQSPLVLKVDEDRDG